MVESRMHTCQEDDHRRNCHDSETARLHEEDQDPVADGAEACADINSRKPGDANGGGCRKEGVQNADGFALGEGHGEKEGPQGNEGEVTRHDHQDGVSVFLLLFKGLFEIVEGLVPRM